jgi:hypothetical protein
MMRSYIKKMEERWRSVPLKSTGAVASNKGKGTHHTPGLTNPAWRLAELASIRSPKIGDHRPDFPYLPLDMHSPLGGSPGDSEGADHAQKIVEPEQRASPSSVGLFCKAAISFLMEPITGRRIVRDRESVAGRQPWGR